jgi:hypothetical protein
MGIAAVTDTLDAVAASVAALYRVVDSEGPSEEAGWDPLRQLADLCLDGLTEMARLDARHAALKVQLADTFVQATKAMASPAVSPQEASAAEIGLVAELACALTVSERTAGAFLEETRQLTTALPLTLAALQAGTISWQHARVLVDETSGVEPAAAAALEEHFLDPDAVNPARGCPAGDLVPSRFRAKARSWRERHHPVSIEQRHRKSVQDRRLEYTPDRDGMAWLSAYLPADTASSIWQRRHRRSQGTPEPVRTAEPLPTPGRYRRYLAGRRRC